MAASARFAPQLIRAMFDLVHEQRHEEARQLFAPVERFRSHFVADMDAGYLRYILYAKATCEVVTLPTGPPSAALVPVGAHEREAIARVLVQIAGRAEHAS